MYEYLGEEVEEMFSELQSSSFIDSVMEPDPASYLQDEIDIQEWLKYNLLTTPMGEIRNPVEPTVMSVSQHGWKNQYGEGVYFTVAMKNSWGAYDLKVMASTPAPVDIWELEEIEPEVVEVIEPEVVPEAETPHVRVQISMKQKGTNIKGRYDNFEISANIEDLYTISQNLLLLFPKVPRKQIAYYTRIQLQNKVGGKMSGGRNLSVHNATPEQVSHLLRKLFTLNGFLPEKDWQDQLSQSSIQEEVRV